MRESHFFQNCGTFCFDLYWKYHNFERNKIRATVFLKWTDFSLLIEYILLPFTALNSITIWSELSSSNSRVKDIVSRLTPDNLWLMDYDAQSWGKCDNISLFYIWDFFYYELLLHIIYDIYKTLNSLLHLSLWNVN